jgi:hypothetical protein
MKTLFKLFLMCGLLALSVVFLTGCDDDDDDPTPQLTGNTTSYPLSAVGGGGVSGTVTFAERDDDQILITIQLNGTQSGGAHPAHIHANSALEGGGIILDLTAVNGGDGKSETVVSALNDGTAVGYEDLLELNGHVNVHASPDDLTIISQGDIGGNELLTDTKSYSLTPVREGATGTATFTKRKNGTTLVTVAVTGTEDGDTHPSHIHENTIAEGGPIVIDLNPVDGATGMARTNVSARNDGTPLTYEELLDFNGYLNVHAGSSFVVQGDIGGNELLSDNKVYELTPVTPGTTGTATFTKRKNATTLVTVAVTGTQDGATHPSHIHANTIAEGGGIVIDLNDVDGGSGVAHTTVRQLNDGTAITYEELLDFNGYLNVHSGSTFVVQGDIGQNELTGNETVYEMTPVADPSVSGTTTFAERANGTSLVTVALTNTVGGASHPSHIHANTIAEGGSIVINLNNVNGTTGMASTTVRELNDGTPITYTELLDFNGYLNVHSGSTFVAQVDIGQNALTGESEEYTLNEVGGSGVSGTATFAERKNGKAQITLALTGTVDGGDHPAHIHANDAATGGGIAVDLKNVNGATGMSVTSINTLNNDTPVTYAELIDFDGHINVHESAANLGTRIAQGNIGSNAP